MPSKPSLAEVTTSPDPELVFAIVSPVGTDIQGFQALFTDLVERYGYAVNALRLSEIAKFHYTERVGSPLDESSEYARINSLMTAGNTLRRLSNRGDVLALHAIAAIRKRRTVGANGAPQPMLKTIHFLRSLKHPDEVEALRRVYGAGFFLIGLQATETQQTDYLVNRKWMTAENAAQLISRDRDENEEKEFGQHTRDTFTLADVFVRFGDEQVQLQRFLELVFSQPFLTPTLDEHAMFLAHAAALRSAQLARQVGAVVVSADDEVIATGANDVPRFDGGLYWPVQDGRPDHRDHALPTPVDSNDREIEKIIANVVSAARKSSKELDESKFAAALREGPVADVTEYGRAVHAEMEALLACARVGVSPRGGTMYTTTFPCHNCTKHIVDAGIRRVVYVEPYPKSKASELHNDSVAIDEDSAGKVQFQPFVGIAARRYFDLFSMRLSAGFRIERKVKGTGDLAPWDPITARPRVQMAVYSYLQREDIAIELIRYAVRKMDQAAHKEAASVEKCSDAPK
jgi:deoxycytidylate deaminase